MWPLYVYTCSRPEDSRWTGRTAPALDIAEMPTLFKAEPPPVCFRKGNHSVARTAGRRDVPANTHPHHCPLVCCRFWVIAIYSSCQKATIPLSAEMKHVSQPPDMLTLCMLCVCVGESISSVGLFYHLQTAPPRFYYIRTCMEMHTKSRRRRSEVTRQ